VFSLAAAVGFFGASPYILIDWSRFLNDIQAVQNTLAIGHDGIVIGRGWSYFGRVVLPAAVGWPMWTAAVAGTLWLLATRLRRSAVLLAFPIAYYLVAGRSLSVFARYILPVVPFVCIIAAWCVVEGVRLALRTTPLPHAARAAVVAVAAIITVAPTARQTVLLDRLLAIADNRLVAAHALADMLRAGEVVYQSGASYGRVPLGLDGRGPALTETGYDEETGRFSPAEPDWVVVQKSPLVTYSRVPASLERQLADRFTLVAQFPTGSDSSTARIYDQQDAFYLPLAGLDGIQRPGPSFDVYKRRAQ
jgi:hypothetical protein